MSYELRCRPRHAAGENFAKDAAAFLYKRDPALRGPDTTEPNPLLEDSFFSDFVSDEIEVRCEDEKLPLLFTLSPSQVLVRLGMGVVGEGAAARVARALGHIFALAQRFDLVVEDPQRKAELQPAQQTQDAAQIAAYLDRLLDI